MQILYDPPFSQTAAAEEERGYSVHWTEKEFRAEPNSTKIETKIYENPALSFLD